VIELVSEALLNIMPMPSLEAGVAHGFNGGQQLLHIVHIQIELLHNPMGEVLGVELVVYLHQNL